MKKTNLDRGWTFRRGLLDSYSLLDTIPGQEVNLPHDGMISTPVRPDAPAQSDMGYFTGDLTNYTKFVDIPKEWENGCVGLEFDAAMMNATVEINGCKVALHHYGYAPFYVDITDYAEFGAKNRITIHTNTSMQPNSRWYTGSGLIRGIKLVNGPKVHIATDGVVVNTKEVSDGCALLEALVDVVNTTVDNCLVQVELLFYKEKTDEPVYRTSRVIQVNPRAGETARLSLLLENPDLWDAENPNLYRVVAKATNKGIYRTHFKEAEVKETDEAQILFGVRTIRADVRRGLQINGKTVKLRGGCLHHDNGLLGAVSLYEAEARKIKKLKEIGFNAIRTTHNPPSSALIEACDRLGMYVFDEAFDAWGIAKRGGDYNQYFATDWETDLTAFVRRDRSHPCVIIWSTGNEIPERGGLNNGYTLATRLADTIRKNDATRPISNGICSYWGGLDDEMAQDQASAQNAPDAPDSTLWERYSEPFTNGLDIVGCNYMEDRYELGHEMFPDRVLMGSENFPKEVGFRWPLVESLPYVIGEFTWTAWDYIGEAGIGKALYVDADDPAVAAGSWALMPPTGSPFPWRTANDADVDITGRTLAQGYYRNIVWGSKATKVFSMHPDTFGKTEIVTMWGFPYVMERWNYAGYEDKPVEIVVFSNAQEVEVFVNGASIGRKCVNFDRPLPNTVRFETVYAPGVVEAVSYTDGREVSRDVLRTSGEAAAVRAVCEKKQMDADGHDLVFVNIDIVDADGLIVTDAEVKLEASLTVKDTETGEEKADAAYLTGFGTGNPVTDEDYTEGSTVSYRGHACAVIRAGYESGSAVLTIGGEGLGSACVEIEVR